MTDEETLLQATDDQTFRPSDATTDTSMSEAGETVQSPKTDTKYMVLEQSLDKLFNRCMECEGGIVEIVKHTRGSWLTVTTTCVSDHVIK